MGEWLPVVFPFLCVMLRTTGLFITAPVLGAKYIPVPVKAGLSLITGYLLWSRVPLQGVPADLPGLFGPALGELAFGLILGWFAALIMAAVEVAGHVVDMSIGFGMANVLDPSSGQSIPVMGTLKHLLITVIFLVMDGHHLFLSGLWDSFKIVPAGAAFIPSGWAEIGIVAAAKMISIAAMLSCPVWASILIVDAALGMVARSVPQMNVFMVGMPVKSLVGLGLVSASVGFYGVFTKEIGRTLEGLFRALLGAVGR